MVKKQNGMIITPGLREPLAQFEDVCTYFKLLRKPIIIRGPRGVGKTLFVQKFIGVNPKVTTGKVIQRNIAALQPNLIESELFGHEKGAFTGATEKKIGLLEQAEDGLLVLEEIGDIPKWVQAKLLTVLEDGNFQRVGGKNNLNIGQLWFFGTTNKPDRAFRPDFLDRFYHFKVPAIHERRGDVLYYLCGLFPTLFEALTSKEVLELLAHPWPGGVREIERVGQEIEIGLLDESICKAKHAGVSSQPCHSRRKRKTKIFPSLSFLPESDAIVRAAMQWLENITEKKRLDYLSTEIRQGLKKYPTELRDALKGDVGKIRLFLQRHGLDIEESSVRPFKNAKEQADGTIPEVERAFEGFSLLASLFAGATSPKNALRLPEMPPDTKPDLSAYSLKDLHRRYYEDLLRATGRNQSEAARRAGISRSWLNTQVKKFCIADTMSSITDMIPARKDSSKV